MLQALRRLFRIRHVESVEHTVKVEPPPVTPRKVVGRSTRGFCEMFIHDEWQEVSVDYALKARGADPKLIVRCPTCHNRAVLHRAKGTGVPAHYEHARGAGPCVVTRGAVPQDNV